MPRISHIVKFTIDKSSSPSKYVDATEEVINLRRGDTIEIKFDEMGVKAEYEVIDIKEKWTINDNTDETYWTEFIVRLVSGTIKEI